MRINSNQYNMNFGSVLNPETNKLKVGIFFAGGGGISHAFKKIEDAEITWLLNHDKTAIKTSSFHNKNATVYWADVYMQDEKEMEPVDLCQASLECDAHTDANVEIIKDEASYTMGWEFYRYLPHLNPSVIHIENVPKFKKWAVLDDEHKVIKGTEGVEFERWKKAIMDLGYEYKESICNAADFGLPTRRVRFFCFFYRPGIHVEFPEATHNKFGTDGKLKWVGCRKHIDTSNVGVSIFGRKYNMALPKHLRKPPVHNSLKRIAGGIKKQIPELYQFLCKFHGGSQGDRTYSLEEPIRTIDTSNRHQLASVEGGQFLNIFHGGFNPEHSASLDNPLNTVDCVQRHQLATIQGGQFIQDHCQTDSYQKLDDPLKTQLTWQTKQLVNIEKIKFILDHCNSEDFKADKEGDQSEDPFIVQYYGGSIQSNNLDEPINTIPCRDTHQLVRIEKLKFLNVYFNSDLDLSSSKLMEIIDKFDIKVRFLRAEELASCSTFPRDYFSHPELKLSQKLAIQLIGNAVPPEWIYLQMEPNIQNILKYKLSKQSA